MLLGEIPSPRLGAGPQDVHWPTVTSRPGTTQGYRATICHPHILFRLKPLIHSSRSYRQRDLGRYEILLVPQTWQGLSWARLCRGCNVKRQKCIQQGTAPQHRFHKPRGPAGEASYSQTVCWSGCHEYIVLLKLSSLAAPAIPQQASF